MIIDLPSEYDYLNFNETDPDCKFALLVGYIGDKDNLVYSYTFRDKNGNWDDRCFDWFKTPKEALMDFFSKLKYCELKR